MTKVTPPVQDKDTHRRAGRDALDRPLVKRFYETASVNHEDGAYHIQLDGRPVRTPAREKLACGGRQLAESICEEWRGQTEWIDPQSMPLTQLANTAIDGVSKQMDEVRDATLAYAGADLLCYRADHPQDLGEKQSELWDPVLEWVKVELGAEFLTSAGVIHRTQPEASMDMLDDHLKCHDAFALSALHVMTTLLGSILLALAIAEGRLSVNDAWRAAHVDEDWQIAQWGADTEAKKRRERRFKEMRSAADFLNMSRS